ncbi:hypothetical protein BX600DRAFT_541193 [Xylariales sp. PMI_506]|nr:hypothetical protein BX600DRAFT_541193 [Xylariales sp. PMI_506]
MDQINIDVLERLIDAEQWYRHPMFFTDEFIAHVDKRRPQIGQPPVLGIDQESVTVVIVPGYEVELKTKYLQLNNSIRLRLTDTDIEYIRSKFIELIHLSVPNGLREELITEIGFFDYRLQTSYTRQWANGFYLAKRNQRPPSLFYVKLIRIPVGCQT